tara:strand:+ start:198 stop:488 length:291 start_codon:yes stop_codon:yes gene_type:complete
MPYYKKDSKKEYLYSFKCGKTEHMGKTDDPLRTLTSHWIIYKHCEKWFSLGGSTKKDKYNFAYDLVIYEDKDGVVKYTYQKEQITKFKFKELINEY